MENMERDNMKTQAGIGLYKIRYEMDVKNSSKEQNYIAGVLAYTSKEAVDTLIEFAKKNVKGFKGMKIEEVSYDGACHAVSESIKTAIVNTAVMEGKVISLEDYEAKIKKISKKNASKKSIIPKE